MATAYLEKKATAEDVVRSMPGRLLKPEEVAAYLNVSKAKVYAMMASGEIPSVKQGGNRRVRLSTLERYIDRLERESA